MITDDEIILAGKFNKPHGINGEIAATLDLDADLARIKCVVTDIDGIYVPFFIESVRPKSTDTVLLSIAGINNETAAATLSNHPIYLLRDDVDDIEDEDEDGFYAEDLIGYTIVDDRRDTIGKIVDYNDSTENVLFVVNTNDGNEIFIPVADELIEEIDTEKKIIYMSLPEGITQL